MTNNIPEFLQRFGVYQNNRYVDHLKSTSGSSPSGFTYKSFDRKTRIYPASRPENYCAFVNHNHSCKAGVWVLLYPPQHILKIWSLVSVPRRQNNRGRAQDLGIKIQHFHSISFLPFLP